jgi:two-component system chemotaxis response regulator CheB
VSSVAAKIAESASAGRLAPIRVMVVDDSVVARGLMKRWLENEPDLEIVASLRTGRQAVDQLASVDPDVVVLDIEMPELDGISALPLLLQQKRDLAVIMASTLTRRNAEITFRALALGALDCIPKPEADPGHSSADFQRSLIAKIREFGLRTRRRQGRLPAATPAKRPDIAPAARVLPLAPTGPAGGPRLRPFPRVAPRVLLIGSSTGGPQALGTVLPRLSTVMDRVPVLVTQHMPPTFTTILAEHLTRVCGRPVREGEDGEAILPGRVYLAPGGRHMRIARSDNGASIALDDSAPVHFCKPAVDPLFTSAVPVWGSAIMGVILTGMGSDGTQGAAAIVNAGGSVIAQDEATSVVWGMPGSVTEAGLCSAVLPVDAIAPKIVQLFSGERA